MKIEMSYLCYRAVAVPSLPREMYTWKWYESVQTGEEDVNRANIKAAAPEDFFFNPLDKEFMSHLKIHLIWKLVFLSVHLSLIHI